MEEGAVSSGGCVVDWPGQVAFPPPLSLHSDDGLTLGFGPPEIRKSLKLASLILLLVCYDPWSLLQLWPLLFLGLEALNELLLEVEALQGLPGVPGLAVPFPLEQVLHHPVGSSALVGDLFNCVHVVPVLDVILAGKKIKSGHLKIFSKK